MNFKNTLKATAVAVAALVGTHASAATLTLTLDGGWSEFSFSVDGTPWSDTFDFTITETAYLKVTDGFCAGDVFRIFIDGGDVGRTTSVSVGPCSASVSDDYDAGYASADFSSGWLQLGADSYTVSGFVQTSPLSGGRAALELVSSLPSGPAFVVPLPAAGLLLLGAIGAGGLVGRRRKSK